MHRLFPVVLAQGLIFLSAAAQADVKIVAQVNVTGQGQSEVPETITTYYQGSRARVEAADGPVTLFDGAGDKVYRLDPDKKTYFVLSLKKMQEQWSRPSGQQAERMSVDAKAAKSGCPMP